MKGGNCPEAPGEACALPRLSDLWKAIKLARASIWVCERPAAASVFWAPCGTWTFLASTVSSGLVLEVLVEFAA